MRSFTRGSARCACCCISWWLVFTALSHGGVVADGSVGLAGAIGKVNNDFAIPHTLGSKIGGNLFHSFSELNLVVGESATFSGPGDAANVLARVTGGSPSSIDGTLRSTIPGANLFLMNPKGVVFGPNASLDVSGSFAVTTADYVKLADGGRFNSTLGSQDSLTSAPVTAFGFLSSAPAGVAFDRTNLVAQDGMGLSVIAGDITLTGATLTAPGGNLSLFSARGTGELPHTAGDPSAPFREAAFPAYGDILLKAGSTAKIDSARGGGKVGIRGGKLVVTESSTISSINQGGNAGGGVELTADTMSFLKGGRAEANAQGSGRGGSLSVRAGELLVDGDDGVRSSSIRSRAESGSGDAGSIAAEASHLILTDGGNINGNTRSAGRGADISLVTESLLISGATAISSPGIFADASNGTGAGGNLDVEIAGALTLGAGGVISSSTFSSGHGGNLTIHAGSMSLDGTATPEEFTGIAAQSSFGATADAGNVTVTVDGALRIVGGALISSSTFSSGRGGNLTIHAGSISLDGTATPGKLTGITAASTFFATANAGNVTVTVDGALRIVGSASISSSTASSGRGGDLTIHAGSLSLDGTTTPEEFTGITAGSAFGATGDAGNVAVNVVGALSILAAEIRSSTASSGHGGNLTIHAGSMSLDGSATPEERTGIFAESRSRATGDAGNVTITVNHALSIVGGAEISSSTSFSGHGGNLTIHAGSISLDGTATPEEFTGVFAESGSRATGDAGSVMVSVDGALSIVGRAVISSRTFFSGHGGDLTIHAGSISLDGTATPRRFTGIDAATFATADAGNVMVTVDGALKIAGGAEISSGTSSSGHGGNLIINAGSMSLDGSATPLRSTGISAEALDTGDAGNVAVNVVGALSILGARIDSSAGSSGHGGDLTIHAGSMSLDGSASPALSTGISAQALDTGDAGNVAVNVVGALSILGAQIDSSAGSSGHGGDITIHAGSMSLDSSAVLFTGIFATSRPQATADAGNVTITVDHALRIVGDAEISSSTFDSGNGGDVVIQADNLKILNGGKISSDTFGKGKGGSVSVASKTLEILNGGHITSNSFSTGKGGSVSVASKTLSIVGSGLDVFTGITSDALDNGNGGDVVIQAGNVKISNAGQISSDTSGLGKGGSVSVAAKTLSIDGSGLDGTEAFTGISSNALEGSGPGGTVSVRANELKVFNRGAISSDAVESGNGGDVVIQVGNLMILNAGRISSDTSDLGKGGSVFVTADSLLIDGEGRKEFTGISSAAKEDSSGNAGDVVVRTRDLNILNRGGISSATSGSGKGGSVSVTADSLLIDGRGATGLTGISAQADRGSGNAGDVVVQAGDLKILNFGTITSGTSSSGNGGSVSVTANSLFIEGRGLDLFTGITAKAESRSTGNAGDVAVAAGDLVLRKNAGITAASATGAPSGSVRITAESVQLDSGSIVSSENTGSGDAGSVRIKVRGDARLENAAVITVAAVAGNAGQIDLESGTNITLLSGSRITASAGLNGGSISLQARDLLYLRDSSITATAGTARGTGTAAGGTGGNISIDPVFVVLDHSTISANAALGAGGNILLRAQNFLSSESPITATGTTAGTVTIAAPDLDLSGALADLAAQLVDTSTRLQERCVMRLGVEVSSFLAIGRGGVEPAPEEVPAQIVARVRRTGIGKVRAR